MSTRDCTSAATQFIQWYRHQRAFGGNTWFSYEELQKATNNFSRALKCAEGKNAVVYKGIEQFSEQFIAVKRLKKVTDASLRKALYEVAVNSYIKKSLRTNGHTHVPLVNLLGFSPYKADPLLVFEFIPNGNLRQHLQGHYGKHLHSHPSDRLRIALDVANALKHLHFNCESPIYHRDVKSTNVLLDRRYRARLADLSNARIMRWAPEHSIESETTSLYSMANIFGLSDVDDNAADVGSPGYVDPVFRQTHHRNDLTDVYSFGVVLLELATLLKAWDDSVRPVGFLPDIVKEKVRGGDMSGILQTAKPGTPEGEVLKQMLFLGIDCCSLDPTSRPRMDEVERVLRYLLEELRATAWVS